MFSSVPSDHIHKRVEQAKVGGTYQIRFLLVFFVFVLFCFIVFHCLSFDFTLLLHGGVLGRDPTPIAWTRCSNTLCQEGKMSWELYKNDPTRQLWWFNSSALLHVLSLGTGEDTLEIGDVLLLDSDWK